MMTLTTSHPHFLSCRKIEDKHKHFGRLRDAIEQHNQTADELDRLELRWVDGPEKVRGELDLYGEKLSFIIADLFFGDSSNDSLDDIINSATEWSTASGKKPLPIIAYTGEGKEALQLCLKKKQKLYDIWDKNTASPEYVTWRLVKMAHEISRQRPDASLQRLIREMHSGASWHSHVVDMVNRYDKGRTERGQVEKAKPAIVNIAHAIDAGDACEKMWKVMLDWEWLSRAVSHKSVYGN